MYVVKYKERVVLGLIPWNSQYITDVMRNRYRVQIDIQFDEPSADEFPYQVNDDIIIYQAEEDRQSNINPLIEYYYGPSWDLVDNKVIARYQVLPLEIQDARNNYKDKAAAIRYEKEIAGTKLTINGVECSVETDRGSKSKYIEKFITMTDEQVVNWKFNEGWFEITKQQIRNIISAIDAHVQLAFDEERELNSLIDQAETSNELLAIEALNINPEEQMLQKLRSVREGA